jgi:iron(III) transport system permease protein
VNPKVEEAGRGLGKPPSAVFFRITLPQLMPGLSAGAALVFLTTIKELPATLLLSPIGFDTLAVQVWSASSEAFFARAALPALILVGLASLPMAYLSLRERKQE